MVTAETAVGPPMLCANADPRAVHLIDGLAAQLREQFHALCDTGRARRMSLGLQTPAGVHRQRAADAGDFGLEELVGRRTARRSRDPHS